MGETSEDAAGSALRQKLMACDEVYVYKIPPLTTSGGHRAEDWNLATPLQTCNLLVERRGDTLVLEFQREGSLFAQATVDLAADKDVKMQHWLEPVVDSSRYFVVKIQGAGGREALIGFGFRDRDAAIDLRESLQHYERSIRRQHEASDPEKNSLSTFSVPKLEDGETIHIGGKSGKSTITKKKDKKGGVPLLLKKPPPSGPTSPKQTETSLASGDVQNLTINMRAVNLEKDVKSPSEEEEGSDGAAFEGDEEWSSDFTSLTK